MRSGESGRDGGAGGRRSRNKEERGCHVMSNLELPRIEIQELVRELNRITEVKCFVPFPNCRAFVNCRACFLTTYLIDNIYASDLIEFI